MGDKGESKPVPLDYSHPAPLMVPRRRIIFSRILIGAGVVAALGGPFGTDYEVRSCLYVLGGALIAGALVLRLCTD
jgi:hypothetical protein